MLPPVHFERLLVQTAVVSEDVASIMEQVRAVIHMKQKLPEKEMAIMEGQLMGFIDKQCEINTDQFKGINRKDLRQGKWDKSLNRIFRRSISWAPA